MKAGERNRRKIFVILNKLCCFCSLHTYIYIYIYICTYNMYNVFSFSTLLLLDSL